MQSTLCGYTHTHTHNLLLCVCVCGRKCLVMSWSWSLGRLTGPASCICRPDSIEPLYSCHGRTPLQAARFFHSLLLAALSISPTLLAALCTLSSLPPRSHLPATCCSFILVVSTKSFDILKQINRIYKQTKKIHNTIHN